MATIIRKDANMFETYTRTEVGVMTMKNGKAWDKYNSVWRDPVDCCPLDPRYYADPLLIYPPDEMKGAVNVIVEKVITVEVKSIGDF